MSKVYGVEEILVECPINMISPEGVIFTLCLVDGEVVFLDDNGDTLAITGAGGMAGSTPESSITFTDITTNNVTSTKHGFAPKSPADATKFLNGGATPAYALVKDSDLSTSDITTNNATTAKHGFTPKYPNDATKYLDGTGAYTVPAGTGGGAPATADYLVKTADATLSAERVVTDTATVAWDWATGGQAKAAIVDDSVTYAKIQNISAASKLLGRGSSGSGDTQEITLGTGLTMTSTTLSVAGSGLGDVVGPASAVDGHLAVFDGPTGKLIKDGGAVPAGGGSGGSFEMLFLLMGA